MIPELKKTTEQKMGKSIEAFKADLAKVRTGRAHTGLLDHVTVDYYGTPTPINQVAKITLMDARTIGVTPFEKKLVQAIEKAIRDSDLGLNPAATGETIRVPMPALTEERRKELIKVVRHEAENARVAVRNLTARRDPCTQGSAEKEGRLGERRTPCAGRRAKAHRPLRRRDRPAAGAERKPS